MRIVTDTLKALPQSSADNAKWNRRESYTV